MKHIALFAIIAITSFVLPACSTDSIERRQQGITSAQSSMLERSEIRRSARDERFRASRARTMGLDTY